MRLFAVAALFLKEKGGDAAFSLSGRYYLVATPADGGVVSDDDWSRDILSCAVVIYFIAVAT